MNRLVGKGLFSTCLSPVKAKTPFKENSSVFSRFNPHWALIFHAVVPVLTLGMWMEADSCAYHEGAEARVDTLES